MRPREEDDLVSLGACLRHLCILDVFRRIAGKARVGVPTNSCNVTDPIHSIGVILEVGNPRHWRQTRIRAPPDATRGQGKGYRHPLGRGCHHALWFPVNANSGYIVALPTNFNDIKIPITTKCVAKPRRAYPPVAF